jgi:hypothetical protein
VTPEPNTLCEGRDPIAAQLLVHAQLISRIRRELDDLAHEATDSVAGLMARVEDLEARPEPSDVGTVGAPTAWCWRTLGQHGTTELWTQLTDWIDWIRSRYPLARKVPSCWAEHPELVEELTALWLAWQQAYENRDVQLTAAADWHDRWLPGVLYRLEHGPFALDCATEHHPRPATAYAEPVPPRDPRHTLVDCQEAP